MRHLRRSLPSLLDRISFPVKLLMVFVLVSAISLSGCASTQEAVVPFTTAAVAPAKTAIYLYRKSRFVGAINKAEIFINNQYAGQLVNGSYCTLVTDPGRVEIKALEKIPAILVLRSVISKLAGKQPLYAFTAEPGREYFLEFNVAGYKVKAVSKEDASVNMSGLPPAEFSPDQIIENGDT